MTKRIAGLLALWLCTTSVGADQTPDLNDIGPKVGVAAREFSATDQFGHRQTLQSLMGRDGLMLVFFRSADW
jgi:hypothetical protein